MKERSHILSLIIMVLTVLLACYFTQSLIPLFTSLVVFILALRLGFDSGEKSLFKGIMETFGEEGYLVYVDGKGDIVIERKYGDHWYKNK